MKVLIATLSFLGAVWSFAAYQPEEPTPIPPHGLSVPCTVVSVYDGDTVVIETTLRARVRLIDCWTPEIRTKDLDQKRKGLAARDHLKRLAEGKTGTLWIPAAGDDIGKVTSLSRVVGRIRLDGDTRDLSSHMRAAGHATKDKPAVSEDGF